MLAFLVLSFAARQALAMCGPDGKAEFFADLLGFHPSSNQQPPLTFLPREPHCKPFRKFYRRTQPARAESGVNRWLALGDMLRSRVNAIYRALKIDFAELAPTSGRSTDAIAGQTKQLAWDDQRDRFNRASDVRPARLRLTAWGLRPAGGLATPHTALRVPQASGRQRPRRPWAEPSGCN